jgi:hypothetical protein
VAENARLIAVERDKEGIRLAALEMLNESLHVEERKRTLRAAEQSADPQQVLAAAAAKREFACGYYAWVAYLFGLETEMQAAIPGTVTAADAVGLLALREARMQFESEHPPCRCGRRKNNAWDETCGNCEQQAYADRGWKRMRPEEEVP